MSTIEARGPFPRASFCFELIGTASPLPEPGQMARRDIISCHEGLSWRQGATSVGGPHVVRRLRADEEACRWSRRYSRRGVPGRIRSRRTDELALALRRAVAADHR